MNALAARWACVPIALLCAVVAASCNSATSGGGATATPSPTPPPYVADNDTGTTNAQPQNCVRKTDQFRYYDSISKQPMPYLQSYTPIPILGSVIKYIVTVPTPPPANQTPIATEVGANAKSGNGITVYVANPLVPVIIESVVYGLYATSDVLLIPSAASGPGNISQAYEQDLKYQAEQETWSQEFTYATQQGLQPTPIPKDDAGKAADKTFQELGVPALNAISVGADADDRFFKGFTQNGVPTQQADPHPRIITCDWLQYRPYDIYVSLLQKRLLPPAQLQQLQNNLRAQEAPSPMLSSAGFVPYEKDVYLFPKVMPQLMLPPDADTLGQGTIGNMTVIFRAGTLPMTPQYRIIKLQIPAPDDTAPP